MQNKKDNITGTFRLVDDREVFGFLLVCGEDSKITLFHDSPFPPMPEYYTYLTGDLHDGRFATLFQCLLTRMEQKTTYQQRSKHSAELFPHFVALGHERIPESEPCITQISFAMKDASSVFYDFDAFSIVLDPTPFIPLLTNDKARIRPVVIEDDPIIGYYTGKFDIVKVETLLGEVKAHHLPTHSMGGPQGFRIDNKVMVTFTPVSPLTFAEVMNQLGVLLRFFELLLGCKQPLINLNIRLYGQDERTSPIEIYRSLSPDEHSPVDSKKDRSPGPADVLVCTVDSTEQFSIVLKNYLASDKERLDSRCRLQNSLNMGRRYTIDRIIAAANMFDIFPKSAYPAKAIISKELSEAKTEARKLFRALPESFERSSVLNALGRIGELSLKHKIRHRVTTTELDKHFPQLMDVLEEAVNCRNHYVHGTPGKIDYSSNFDTVCFFTDALEFVFGASDLIEAGWSLLNWKSNLPGADHPFGAFIVTYKERLEVFNKLRTVGTISEA